MKKKKIFEGRSKKIYEIDSENELLLEFKDEFYNPKSRRKTAIKSKGAINNQVSSHLFRYLDSYHIPTHFLEQVSKREMRIKKIEMIPIKVMVRNIAFGDLVERFGIEEGVELDCPVLEYYFKDDKKQNALINEDHIVVFGHATNTELKEIHRLSSKINVVLKDFFRRRNYKLVDARLEFGRYRDRIVLGDEISPETCQLWDLENDCALNMAGPPSALEKEYQQIAERLA